MISSVKQKDTNPIKVLQIAHGMETLGGVENFLLQYYRYIDHNKVSFDFLFCGNNTLEKYKDDIVLSKSNVVALNNLKSNRNTIKNYLSMIKNINIYLSNNDYHIIHINTSNITLQFIIALFIFCKNK